MRWILWEGALVSVEPGYLQNNDHLTINISRKSFASQESLDVHLNPLKVRCEIWCVSVLFLGPTKILLTRSHLSSLSMNLPFHQRKRPSQEEYKSSPKGALSCSGVVMHDSWLLPLYLTRIQRHITHCEQDRLNGKTLFTVCNVSYGSRREQYMSLIFNFMIVLRHSHSSKCQY
jgi:hypothetical protein